VDGVDGCGVGRRRVALELGIDEEVDVPDRRVDGRAAALGRRRDVDGCQQPGQATGDGSVAVAGAEAGSASAAAARKVRSRARISD
jgi:hypothetical protein